MSIKKKRKIMSKILVGENGYVRATIGVGTKTEELVLNYMNTEGEFTMG